MSNKPIRLEVDPQDFKHFLKNLLPNIGGQHEHFIHIVQERIINKVDWIFPITISEDELEVEFYIENQDQKSFLEALKDDLIENEFYESAQTVHEMLIIQNLVI